jgi:hypothetical protein
MKHFKFQLVLQSAFLFGIILSANAQETLPEVTVRALRYKYLNAVDQKDLAQPVKLLQRQAAEYDVKKSPYFDDESETYFISFFIPDGALLATYDSSGKLLRTAEKYKGVSLPKTVTQAVTGRFPQWRIPQDTYLVNYYEESGATKIYKLTLENGDKRIRVKLNDKGEFL